MKKPNRSRRSTRGRGRRVTRRRAAVAPPRANDDAPVVLATPALLPSRAQVAEAIDESLYRLGDGSDLPTIDVRADLEVTR